MSRTGSKRKIKKLIRLLRGRVGIVIMTIFALCLFGVMIHGCGKHEKGAKVVFTKKLEKDEIFRIGDEICKASEMKIFLSTTRHEYESVYGEKIWNTSANGESLESNVKASVLEKVAQLKSMYLLAKNKGVELDEMEKSFVSAAARDYYGRLSAAQKQEMGVTEESVAELYEEYALAHKVYKKVIEDVNPEISDDEARIVTVMQIMIKTTGKDAQGNETELMTAQKQRAYETACDIWQQAIEGKKSFEELASRYSQDTELTISFGKGEMDPAVEAAAFKLETGEISSVVEGAKGYYVLKCVSTFDAEETAANKQRLLEEKRNEVFGQEYDAFVDSLVRTLNQSAWDGLELVEAASTADVDFFEVYEKFFAKK